MDIPGEIGGCRNSSNFINSSQRYMAKSGQHFEYASCNFVSKMNDLNFFLTVCQNLLAYTINRGQISCCLLSNIPYLQYGVLTKKLVINEVYSNLPFYSKNKNIQWKKLTMFSLPLAPISSNS